MTIFLQNLGKIKFYIWCFCLYIFLKISSIKICLFLYKIIKIYNVNKYSGGYINFILYVRNDYAELPFSHKTKLNRSPRRVHTHREHARPCLCLLVGHFDWRNNVKIFFCSQFKALKGPVLKQGCWRREDIGGSMDAGRCITNQTSHFPSDSLQNGSDHRLLFVWHLQVLLVSSQQFICS